MLITSLSELCTVPKSFEIPWSDIQPGSPLISKNRGSQRFWHSTRSKRNASQICCHTWTPCCCDSLRSSAETRFALSRWSPCAILFLAKNNNEVFLQRGRLISEDPEEELRQKQIKALLNKITPEKYQTIMERLLEVQLPVALSLSGLIDQARPGFKSWWLGFPICSWHVLHLYIPISPLFICAA